MEPILILALLTGFVGCLAFIFLLSLPSFHRPHQFAWQPLQTNPIPYRRRSFLFSAAERSVYKALRTLVPDHMIFVKVPLSDLVSIPHPKRSFWEYFSPINHKQIDFVVCDPTLSPVLAIEVDHMSRRSADDDLLKSVLRSAALPMLRLPEKRRYQFADLRNLLVPYLHVPAPLL